MLDPHALARAASAVVVVVAAFGIVQPARVRRREERDALFVVRGGYDARAEHGSRALDRDVDERFRVVVVDASGPSDVVVARRSPSVTLAGAGRNMAGDASMRNTRDSRSDCGRVVGRGISGWRRKGWHPGRRMMLAGSRRDVRGGGFRVCRGRVTPATSRGRTSGRNSSSSSSSSSWMLRHELAIVVFSRV